MNTFEFLSYLRSLEVKLSADGDRLRCSAPKGVVTPTLQAEISERKAEILTLLHEANLAQESTVLPIRPIPRDGNLPASSAQQRLWFLDQLEPGSSAYNIPLAYRLTGQLNVAALEQSVREIVRRHEILRTTLAVVDGQPFQVISPEIGLTLPIVNLQELPETEREPETQRLVAEEAQQPFDLAQEPLLRVKLLRLAPEEHLILVTMHHIVSDGWSFSVFFQELAALYEAFCTGKPSPLPELPIQYADFAHWQQQWLQSKELEAQLAYWKQQLGGNLPVLELPTDHPRPPVQTYRGANQSLLLPKKLSEALKALSHQEGVTLFMTLLAAFKTLLCRCTGQEDIIVGSPIAGRNRAEIERLIGFFISTLVMRSDLSGNPSFRELLGRVREVTLGAYAHQDVPFEKLVEELQPERDLSRTPLFQVWFNMYNWAAKQVELLGLTVEFFSIFETSSKFDLNLYVLEKKQGIELKLVYNADLFESARMVEMIEQFKHLLMQIVEQPEERIDRFSLVTPKAEIVLPNPIETLGCRWEGAVHTHFAQQVRRVPEHLAVVDALVGWSYAELDARSNQLANYLLGNGIQRQDIVAIYGHRSASLVWALLGVLKAGAAFIILDPAYPASRLIDCLRLAQPRGWLQLADARKLPATLEEFVGTLSCCCRLELSQNSIASEKNPLTNYGANDPEVAVEADDLLYVAFTSGSTGIPKGILGTHRPVSHFLEWHCREFGFKESDRFCMLSGLSHDPLLRNIFTPLWLGATLYIPQQKDIETPGQLVAWMQQQQVSIAHLTPAMGQLLSETKSDTTTATNEITSLRYLFFGGDVLTQQDVSRIRKLAPKATSVNFYGSTETPQAMGYFIVPNHTDKLQEDEPKSVKEAIPLGRGIADVQLLVLNTSQQLAGIGEVGEIYVRTPYLAKGYIGSEELTQERFLINPFTKQSDDRLYQTGDLGRYLPDGNIEFLGRIDHQVKIRGFRIELGEIEAVLAQNPSVRETRVIAREDQPGDKRLVAYVVPNQEQAPKSNELRSFLKEKLPNYMVPSAFVMLEALPLTPNGKVNRRALPAPEQAKHEAEETFVAPRDEIELLLSQVWEKVLGIQSISVNANFFDLGGHSLLAVRLFSQIEKSFGKNLPLATLFQAPTVEQLANVLRFKGWSAPWRSLVAIQPLLCDNNDDQVYSFGRSTASKPPLFCVPGLGGNVLYYRDLARYLGSDQPFYGLQARGLDGKEAPFSRIEDMAAHYIKEIRTIQPEGPYFLGGHSFGGTVAFEMAQQLHKQGQKVALLALFDAASPKLLLTDSLPLLERFSIHSSNLSRLKPKQMLKYVLVRVKFHFNQLYKKLKVSSRSKRSLPDYPQSANIIETHYQAFKNYELQFYPDQVTLFRSREGYPKYSHDPQLGWGELAVGGLEIYEISGPHEAVLEEPHVRGLAEKLRACLEQARKQQFGDGLC
jgi:amino acid adenylation domain-containing protein